jgi:SAM-dependent methyltransferase
MTDADHPYAATIERFSGFARDYDRYRPSPPAALAPLLALYTRAEKPGLVIDLGSGTGLSSRYWAERGAEVIGIEPSADMRNEALRRTSTSNVRYQEGFSQATGLPAGCAQIVTCMQSLHWMEPQGTFKEARRILAAGGVFAAVDYAWPPMSVSWRADQAWIACNARANELEASLPGVRPPRWDKSSHATRMRASGCFQFVRDLALHHVDAGGAERFVGLLRSQGGVMDLLKAGYSEHDLGIDVLEGVARSELGEAAHPFYWSARVSIGVV